MRKIKRSLVITSLFPKTLVSFDELKDTVLFLAGSNNQVKQGCFQQLEFYHPPGRDEEIAKLFKDAHMESIFIAVPELKGANLSLCSLDENERIMAVNTLKTCMDRAIITGSHSIMFNSGSVFPDSMITKAMPSPEQIKNSCTAYLRSLEEIGNYREKQGYTLSLLLEPGDKNIHYFQLLGDTDLVVKTCREISIPGYSLTMDIAHTRLNNEDVISSLGKTLPWCNHIHLCNCVIDNPMDPFFGDYHVDFDFPGASWTYADFADIFEKIKNLYTERDFTISLEISCRAEYNKAWFNNVISKCPWFFTD